MGSSDTIIWITGATKGIGAGLVRTCPYPGARIINASRSEHPETENIRIDLGDVSSWTALRDSFRRELQGFQGQRALFIHNAMFDQATGFVGEVDEDTYFRDVMGNGAAPLVFGDWFARAVAPGYESGMVMMSSGSARMVIEGHSVYCAAKAGMEQWVRVFRAEQARRGAGTWCVAIRPGFVATEGARWEAELDPEYYPIAPMMKAALESGQGFTADEAAQNVWDSVPPPPDGKAVLLFGAPPEGV